MKRHIGVISLLILFTFATFSTPSEARKGAKKRSPARTKKVKKSRKGGYVIEKRADGTTVKYKDKQSYDFEGTDIEGLFKRPSGSYISNIKGVKGKSIIRIRKNFDAEVIDSARAIR